MKAYALEHIDDNRDMHWQAWLNQQVKATRGRGKNVKPYYRNFDEFFDHEEKERMIYDPRPKVVVVEEEQKTEKIIDLAAMANA